MNYYLVDLYQVYEMSPGSNVALSLATCFTQVYIAET